jgi:hypothetical protein
MKLIINGNEATILVILSRGSEVQNLKTEKSDKDFSVVFVYDTPNMSLNDYPTDIQKGTYYYDELKTQLIEQGHELEGDIVFKELRSLFLSSTSTESYDYFFISDEFVLYQSLEWKFIAAMKPLFYNHNELLNHLWRKVGAFRKAIVKNPRDTSRYIYYARLYQQTFHTGTYTPWIDNEEWASEIRDVKLGGTPLYALDDYKFEVEKLHLNVEYDKDSNEEVKCKIMKFKSNLLLNASPLNPYNRTEYYRFALPINTSLVSSCQYVHDANDEHLLINFSTHPEDTYVFQGIKLDILKEALEAKSFGRYFKQYIENKYTVYKNGELLTKRDKNESR